MERLTKVDDQGRLLAYSINDTGLPAIIMSGNPYREIIERLRAYEDTGLEPEEMRALKGKQIPQKPDMCNMTTVCPGCGTTVKRCFSYCRECGQAIDWEK